MNNKEMIARTKKATIEAMTATANKNGRTADFFDMWKLAGRLHRLEATLERLACDQCNYPIYDAAKQERIENLAVSLISDFIGCECYTQRDPRGYCIRMYLQDENGRKYSNSWDGETAALAW